MTAQEQLIKILIKSDGNFVALTSDIAIKFHDWALFEDLGSLDNIRPTQELFDYFILNIYGK